MPPGKFRFKLPDKFKDGKFGDYEVIGFTAEETGMIKKNGANWEATSTPTKPSGTKRVPSPAFYLFAALAGRQDGIALLRPWQRLLLCQRPEKADMLRLLLSAEVFGMHQGRTAKLVSHRVGDSG